MRRVLECAALSLLVSCGATPAGGQAATDSGAPDRLDASDAGGDVDALDGAETDALDGGGVDATEGSAGDASDAGGVDASDGGDPCTLQDHTLQSLLDSLRAPAPNALLAVRDPGCGTRVYLSGSTQTATMTSLWRIASVTKTFTSTAVLSLVHEGKVSLDDALSKWVSNVPNTTGVTVRMLLDHRSGIYNYMEDPTFDFTKAWTPQQLVAFATTHAPYFAPDMGWHYSNTNYILLGMILEAATGLPAGAVLHARAIDAAGLSSTLFDGYDAVDPARMTRGFRQDGTDCTFYNDPSVLWTCAAIVSDGADTVNWLATVFGTDTVLDAATRALFTSKTSDMTEECGAACTGMKYGLGVYLLDPSLTGSAGQGIGHDGSLAGFYTAAYYFPDKQTAVVWMLNDDVGGGGFAAEMTTLQHELAAVKTLFP